MSCPGSSITSKITGTQDRCFEVILDYFTVKIGNPGTDDDVTMRFCSDVDSKQCCDAGDKGKVSSFGDDWSTGDTETWDDSYFGDCENFKFTIRQGLKVTVAKSKTGKLNITSIDVYTKTPGYDSSEEETEKNHNEPERLQCNGTILQGTDTTKTLTCNVGPYKYIEIDNMVVKIGSTKDDGTDDSVKVKVCSDTNDVCCTVKLSHSLQDDWSTGDTENWPKKEFEGCGKILYKITNRPSVSVIKEGRDDLIVKSFQVTMKTPLTPPITDIYNCEGFALKGDCRKVKCVYNLAQCVKQGAKATTTTTTQRTTTKKSIFG